MCACQLSFGNWISGFSLYSKGFAGAIEGVRMLALMHAAAAWCELKAHEVAGRQPCHRCCGFACNNSTDQGSMDMALLRWTFLAVLAVQRRRQHDNLERK